MGLEMAPLWKPSAVRAEQRVAPRGSADSVIFLNLRGGPSQMDTFDVKEGPWTPQDFDIRTTKQGFQWPYGLMPKLTERLDDLCIIRSMEAWDTVHSRAQFYLQTGHQPSPARNAEMPSVGSVVAYEHMGRRTEQEFLPPFVAMNYDASTMFGALQKSGCLPPDYSPLALDLSQKTLPFRLEEAEVPRFERRWDLLQKLDVRRAHLGDPGTQAAHREFASYAAGVRKMMLNPRLKELMTLSDEERKRYGSTPFGDGCILARNMVAADAGAKFVMVTHSNWDHHGNIYKKDAGLYKLCPELDFAFAALLADLKGIRRKDGSSQLDRTLVVAMGEFGRTPGELTLSKGREHYAGAMNALFAGAGVRGGRVIGATDDLAAKVMKTEWSGNRSIYMEDVCITIYSALGIDWNKRITGTPSGRDFVYVDSAAGTGFYNFQEIRDLYS
jgi:hypothetical protein